MRKVMTSVAGGKILLAKTNWFFHEKSLIFDRKRILAAGGEPSTRFPPEGLVETAGVMEHYRRPRSIVADRNQAQVRAPCKQVANNMYIGILRYMW